MVGNKRFNKAAFTLLEILVVVTILTILSVLSYSHFSKAILRSQITTVVVDLRSIRFALENYYSEHLHYPNTYRNDFHRTIEIHRLPALTTPINYLKQIPHVPWENQVCEVRLSQGITKIRTQPNYLVTTKPRFDTPINRVSVAYLYDSPGWTIFCGGPASPKTSSQSKRWYNPSNGLYSIGGFWYDSNGLVSFASWH